MITRKRSRKPTAADNLATAHAALYEVGARNAERERQQKLTYEQAKAEPHVDAHDRLDKALKASMAGIMRAGGKEQENTKTQRRRSKYDALITVCDANNIPLGTPHTKARIDAVMRVAEVLDPSLTRDQVLKHLQRHYK